MITAVRRFLACHPVERNKFLFRGLHMLAPRTRAVEVRDMRPKDQVKWVSVSQGRKGVVQALEGATSVPNVEMITVPLSVLYICHLCDLIRSTRLIWHQISSDFLKAFGH